MKTLILVSKRGIMQITKVACLDEDSSVGASS